jgi:hypothetical protein
MHDRRYPVPTHLAVEPAVVRLGVGLTLRQFACLAVGAGFAYLVIKRLHLGGPQLLLAAAIVAVALVIAFVRVGGRPVERWLRDRLAYAAAPRVRVWRPQIEAAPPPPAGAWASRPVRVAWAPGRPAPARDRPDAA